MTDDNGHEPERLDESLVLSEIRKGGALVSISVKFAGAEYRAQQIIPGIDLTQTCLTRTDLVRLIGRRLIDGIDVEPGEAGG